MDITAIGEILIDLTQNGCNAFGIPEYTANPGGAPANLAVAAAKMGAKTAFIGKVGDDSFGAFLKKTLTDNGVDISGMTTDSIQHTTLAVVSVDACGERSFSFYRDSSADVNLTRDELPYSLLQKTKILHFGSVSLTADPARTATLAAAQYAKNHGALITYDPNYRANLWADEETAVVRMKEPLPIVDVLKVSDEELPLLTGTSDLEKGTRRLADYGVRLILVTLGPDGAFYRFDGNTGHIPGVPCIVGDTNGAGDTFFGVTVSQLSQFASLDELNIEVLESIIALANKAASITTCRRGAIPAMPTKEEVLS